MKNFITRFLALFFLSLSVNAEVSWQTDMLKAQKIAEKEGKDIFAYFTGSDWCSFCIRLKKEVFDKGDFLEKISKDYVLLKIDFPQKKPLPEAMQIKNDRLSEDYSIKGFPTVLLLDDSGRTYAKTGFRNGGPANYLEHLGELQLFKDKRDSLFKKAESQNGLEKAKLLADALKGLGDVPMLHYKSTQDEIVKNDPEDKTGYKKDVLLKNKVFSLEETLVNLLEKGKRKEAVEVIETFLADKELKDELRQKVMLYKVYTYEQGSVNLDEVIKYMDSIIEINPKSDSAEDARTIKSQVENMKKEQEK